ncbi:hypothetical protein E3N88_31112 [Mikania micrantha]|uniref:LITAF domain-containing protein n=1 Tax=Mikania micrantha TaxID=192012 RepID=A0A5N6MP28_9ASTR|nr:hypothetical protein E3N88_31112 [Mikania micrantha]
MEKKNEEPVMGIPYNPNYQHSPIYSYPSSQYHIGNNPYQSRQIPPNAIVGDPKGFPLHQTIYRDTPAPINCVFCDSSGLTTVRYSIDQILNLMKIDVVYCVLVELLSKPSMAAFVGCMMTFMIGVCFLCPSMDCLWHKSHYCPYCNEKLAEFEKNDVCAVMDPPSWREPSFALPA